MVNFDPAIGAEIQKVRPAVVMSPETVGRLPLKIVVPLTEWRDLYFQYPWFVRVPADVTNGLLKDSGADTFQVRSLSISRFRRLIGDIDPNIVELIASSVSESVGPP